MNKLAANIYNYKEKNQIVTNEDYESTPTQNMEGNNYINQQPSEHQIYIDSEGQAFQGWNHSGTFNKPQIEMNENDKTPVINGDIEELIRKYEVKSPGDEETKEDGFDKRLEGVSFGFRNEKIKENLRKDYKKLRVKHTRSEGVIILTKIKLIFNIRDLTHSLKKET